MDSILDKDLVDSDDDLPDLPSNLFTEISNDINEGDIVWAKFKKLYWPALVRRVYKKEKKITVWYTDDPGKTFKIPVSSVYLFHDTVKSKQFRDEAVAFGCAREHDGLLSHALTYLNRKAEGYNDDPLEFFDQTYPYFLVQEFLRKNPDADKSMFSGLKIEPLYINHKISTFKSPVKKGGSLDASEFDKSDDVDFQMELVRNESDEENEKRNESDYENEKAVSDESDKNKVKTMSLFNNEKFSAVQDDEYVNKIIACIKSGKADVHLFDVKNAKTNSFYHKFYMKCIKNNNKQELDYICYGPVENLENLREISGYLLDLYDILLSYRSKKCQKLEMRLSVGERLVDSQYVAYVWLPESIIFAMSYIDRTSLDEASEKFHQNSSLKPKKLTQDKDEPNRRSDKPQPRVETLSDILGEMCKEKHAKKNKTNTSLESYSPSQKKSDTKMEVKHLKCTPPKKAVKKLLKRKTPKKIEMAAKLLKCTTPHKTEMVVKPVKYATSKKSEMVAKPIKCTSPKKTKIEPKPIKCMSPKKTKMVAKPSKSTTPKGIERMAKSRKSTSPKKAK